MAKIPGTYPVTIELVGRVGDSTERNVIGTIEVDAPVQTTVYKGTDVDVTLDVEGFREAMAVALEETAHAIRNEKDGW